MEAIGLWLLWQAALAPYAACFHDARGFRRFVEWITGLALNVEEHTITQSLVGLDRERDWKALEAFAEYAAFNTRALECVTARVLEAAPGKHLLVHDGGFALHSVVRPLVCPEQPELPRVDVLTRLRHDARLYVWPPPERTGRQGRPPVWGRRLAPPRQGGRWPGPWQ